MVFFGWGCFWDLEVLYKVVAVQSLSGIQLFVTPLTAACPVSLSFSMSQSLLKLTSIESVMPSNHLILCHHLLLLASIFPSIRVFSNELALRIRWPKYWSFSISVSPSNKYSGLIFFRIDCFHLLAVQRTLKSLLQHHNSKTSILCCSTFFMIQLSLWLLEKTKVLTIRTFVGNVMSLLFNMLSRLVMVFLPRRKYHLILWLLSVSAMILESKSIKSSLFPLFPHLFAMKWWDWMPWS